MNRYQPRIPTALALGVCQYEVRKQFAKHVWKQMKGEYDAFRGAEGLENGKDYLVVKVATDMIAANSGAHIRLHRGQVIQLIKALEKFVNESKQIEGGEN